MLWRPGALREGGVRPYRRRRQSADQAEVPVLVGRAAGGPVRRLGREGEGDAWLMVARLARLVDRAGAGESPRPQARRGKARSSMRRARGLCASEVLAT